MYRQRDSFRFCDWRSCCGVPADKLGRAMKWMSRSEVGTKKEEFRPVWLFDRRGWGTDFCSARMDDSLASDAGLSAHPVVWSSRFGLCLYGGALDWIARVSGGEAKNG